MAERITINRAPVLTLWAAVVAERLGHERDTSLSLGKCLSGLNAQSKGRRLGIFGALVFYWQQADGFWEYVLAVFQGLFWPAFMVYEAFSALAG